MYPDILKEKKFKNQVDKWQARKGFIHHTFYWKIVNNIYPGLQGVAAHYVLISLAAPMVRDGGLDNKISHFTSRNSDSSLKDVLKS